MQQIDETLIYDVTLEFMSARESRNWHARLRRRGFKRSECGEAYYHPKHWSQSGKGPGDYWIMSDAFYALTIEAKLSLEVDE